MDEQYIPTPWGFFEKPKPGIKLYPHQEELIERLSKEEPIQILPTGIGKA